MHVLRLPATYAAAAALPCISRLLLVVLNGCTTFDVAQAILVQCPTVEFIICWKSPVHSEAATVFATALADTHYLGGNDDLAIVSKAFHAAKAAVLEHVQLSHLRGVGPIGTPLYTFLDPKNVFTTYQECPCANRCQNCPCVSRESNAAPSQCVLLLTRACKFAHRWIGREKSPNADARQMPPVAAGIPVLIHRTGM